MLPLGVRIPLSLLPFLVAGRGVRCDELTRVTVRGCGCRIDSWCEPAIVGVVNMTRGFRALVSLLVFRLSSNSGRTTDSDSVNPGSSPGGRAEKHMRSRVVATLFLSLALCLSG